MYHGCEVLRWDTATASLAESTGSGKGKGETIERKYELTTSLYDHAVRLWSFKEEEEGGGGGGKVLEE